jgi:hypothetical protein
MIYPNDIIAVTMRPPIKPILATLLFFTLAAAAQEIGYWRASSQAARTITGDIALSPEKLTVNFLAFPIARIRALTPAEIDAAFSPDPGTQGSASLYRLDVSASQKFLHKNTLCGTDETKWMATYASGRTLTVTLFSDDKPPVFTREALTDSPTLCGTFSYAK